MLVSIHIPKTGGTSFNEILRANFRKVLGIAGPPDIHSFLKMSPDERSSYPAAAGHMPFGIDRYVTVPCRYVVFLRDPVDHALSSYYYVLRTPTNPQHERASKMSLREYVESDVWWINDNLQTRWLSQCDWPEVVALQGLARRSPCTAEDLRQAKANLDRCEFVGLYDRFQECVRLCCDRFALKYTTIPHLNATVRRPAIDDLDPEVRTIIRERRRFDVELYEYAAERRVV
jgi:hypothetical protein